MKEDSHSYTPQEFLDKLGKDELDVALTLMGMVKASDTSAGELMFVPGTRCGNWTSIPIEIVETIEVLGSTPCDDHQHARVKLTFKAPQSPESAAFASLLSAAVKQQRPGKRVVHKSPNGGSAGSQRGTSNFLANCGCSDYEIDADGRIWTLVSVTTYDDGSCICDYS